MKVQTRIAPPNSVILVMEPGLGEVPRMMGGQLVSATPSCVAVGTLAEFDGETTITLSSAVVVADDRELGTLVFEQQIVVSGGRIAVCTVRLDAVLEIAVEGTSPRVRIWVNDLAEPDAIHIVVDS